MAIVKRTEKSLGRWDPLQDFERTVAGTLADLFDMKSYPALWSRTWEDTPWKPSIEVLDKGEHYLVRAELPGLKKNDIDLSVSDHTLTISGERKEDKESKEKDYVYREYRYGSFYRSIPLPTGLDLDTIAATYEDGILEITVPKVESKKIEVQAKTGKK
jgi:HSP20 family protein